MNRRNFLRWLGGGGLVVLGGGVSLLGGGGRARLWEQTRRVMGTHATILLPAHSREVGEALFEAAFSALRGVDERMSRFRPGSDIGRINSHPAIWQEVEPMTAEVLEAGLRMARASDGYFDPCLEREVSDWGFHDRNYPPGPLPARETGKAVARYRNIIKSLTPGNPPRYRLAGPGAGIDLGGIAKGFAIDRAVAVLRNAGVTSALVNAGDDLFALGGHPHGGPWRIGVRHPRRVGEVLEVMAVRDRAVATSGDYENYFFHGGRRYGHLFDPHSGRPAQSHQSFTITARQAVWADALATAAFAAPQHAARRMLQRLASGPWLAVDVVGSIEKG